MAARLGLLVTCALGCLGAGACGGATAGAADAVGAMDAAPDGADGLGEAGADVARSPFDQCEPGVAPDEACFASRRDPSSALVAQARALADAHMARHPAEDVGWDWGEAVAMLGVVQLYRVTGETRYLDYVTAWMDHHIAEGYRIETSDSCAPAGVAVRLYGLTGQERYRGVVEDALDYLFHRALRSPEGGLNHLGTVTALPVTLWVDSLFMFGNVLTGWGEVAGDPAALGLEGEQIGIFASVLQDPSGLFTHAAYWPLEQTPGIFWARGNAWVTAATVDYLRARRWRGEEDPAVAQVLERQLGAVRAWQDGPSGRWWTVMNRPGETYLETSATALWAFALARAWRSGLVGDEVLPAVDAAVSGLDAQMVSADDGPRVGGVSGPTTAGDFDNYAHVSQGDDFPWGVGAALLAWTEASGLPRGRGGR